MPMKPVSLQAGAVPLVAAALALLPAPAPAFDTLIVANKDAATVWLLDPASGERRAEVPVGNGPHEAAVSPDG